MIKKKIGTPEKLLSNTNDEVIFPTRLYKELFVVLPT